MKQRGRKPIPFTRKGYTPDVLAILDELDKMKASHQNDARRHLSSAERVEEMRVVLLAKFRSQLNKKRAR